MAPLPAVTALPAGELEDRVEALGFPRFHARQVRTAVLKRGARSFEGMTDLPEALRAALSREVRPLATEVAERRVSRDGTVKLLVRLEDGETVETVVIPEGDRVTACVSTEVGCPVRCAFCASGLGGLRRPLRPHEVVEQVLHAREAAREEGHAGGITNLVLMGMGEPLLNYEATVEALRAIRDPGGIRLGARRITLSTVGIVEGIERLAREGHPINLAVSLHAPDDETRTRLIPLNRRYGVARVVEAARAYAAATRRDVTFEYVLLGGVNDSDEAAARLADLVAGAHLNVNLIPWNRVEGIPFESPAPGRVEAFRETLRVRGVVVHVRRRRGDDIDAACGQLRLRRDPEAR